MRTAHLLVAVGISLAGLPLAAQEPAPTATIVSGDSLVLTLREALLRAEPASEQVNIFRFGVDRARAEKTVAWSTLLPQATLTPQYQRVIETPFRQFFEESGGGLGGDNPFTATSNWRVGGNVTWTPVDFAAYSRIEGTARAVDGARLQVSQQQAFTILTVASAYYNAILADQLLAIRVATLEQAERTYKEIQLGYEVGTQSEFDALRARVARDNQVPVVTRARADREITFTQLKQLLDIPIERPLNLVTPLDAGAVPAMPDSLRTQLGPADTTVDGRNVTQQAQIGVRQARAFYDAAGRQWLPTLGGTLNYNQAGFATGFWPESNGWFDDFNVGFGVRWPLFTGGRILGQRRAAQADLQIAEESLKLTREQAALDNVSVTSRLVEAEDNAQATQSVVEQAQRAYEIAELRFREGLSTQTELQDVRIQLEAARANQASAFRDLQVARLRLALLPYLPIGTADPSIVNAGISTRQAIGSVSSSITSAGSR
jgi:outer membrane protein TolC